MIYHTVNCIVCGKKAMAYCGHVIAKRRMAFGNYVPTKVLAGFCDEHLETLKSDDNGCFGDYNSDTMGKCEPHSM